MAKNSSAAAAATSENPNAASGAQSAPQAPPASKHKVNKSVDPAKGIITITIDEGEPTNIDISGDAVHYDVKVRAMMETLARRLYVSARDNGADGLSKTLEQFKAGHWSARGDGSAQIPIVVRALARLKGWKVEEAKSVWDGLKDADKTAVRSDPSVRKMIATIREEERGEDATSVLDNLALS